MNGSARHSGRLQGKVAVVTGAGSGIGRAAALLFAAEGARVALLSRTADSGEVAATQARAGAGFDGDAVFTQTDVTKADQVQHAIVSTLDRWGRIDVAFNAAGISGRKFGDGPTADCTLEGWQTTLDANLTSIFLCCRAILPHLIAAGGGSLINLASVLGMTGGDEDFATHAYAASKGGIIALTRSIATYYASSGVRANAIAPGLIRTNMSLRAQSNPAIIAKLARLQPLTGDFGAAADVAAAALYLASDESAFVTGITLPVDGGWTAQ